MKDMRDVEAVAARESGSIVPFGSLASNLRTFMLRIPTATFRVKPNAGGTTASNSR